MNKVYVIGIGYKPLDKRAREIVEKAGAVLATTRLLTIFQSYDIFETVKDRIVVLNNVGKTIDYAKSAITKGSPLPIVLLASGDPMFSGIGSKTARELGKEVIEIIPDLSSIQIAFSRIKEPWEEAFLMSFHGGPDPEKRRRLSYEIAHIPRLIREHRRIAILTDRQNNPAAIARALPPGVAVYVFEKLGYDDERITEGSPDKIAVMNFVEPNLVIIKRIGVDDRGPEERFGLSENDISHSRGLITKDEVRAITLHALRLPSKGVFWDVGAGSGSISIEAARLCPELTVYAIEKEEEQVKHIVTNRFRFDSINVNIVQGTAPDALSALPQPDRVFVGGSKGKLKSIVDVIADTAATIVVIGATTIKAMNETIENLKRNGFRTTVTGVSVTRIKAVVGNKHASALNPVFIIKGERLP